MLTNKENDHLKLEDKDDDKLLELSEASNLSSETIDETIYDMAIFYLKTFVGTFLIFFMDYIKEVIVLSFLGTKYNNPHIY